jgi:hypothetical protein
MIALNDLRPLDFRTLVVLIGGGVFAGAAASPGFYFLARSIIEWSTIAPVIGPDGKFSYGAYRLAASTMMLAVTATWALLLVRWAKRRWPARKWAVAVSCVSWLLSMTATLFSIFL